VRRAASFALPVFLASAASTLILPSVRYSGSIGPCLPDGLILGHIASLSANLDVNVWDMSGRSCQTYRTHRWRLASCHTHRFMRSPSRCRVHSCRGWSVTEDKMFAFHTLAVVALKSKPLSANMVLVESPDIRP